MAFQEHHITRIEDLDNYVTFSHRGEIAETLRHIREKDMQSILRNKEFLGLVHDQATHAKSAPWGELDSKYSAIVGINLARKLGIPCIEYDETASEQPDLTANKQYVLLRWTRANPKEFESNYQLRTSVHTMDGFDYSLRFPSNDDLAIDPLLSPGQIRVEQMLPRQAELMAA